MQELIQTEMTISREGEKEYEVDIEGYVKYSVDNRYGADADGNRAMTATFLEEVVEVCVTDDEGDDVDVTEEEMDQARDLLGNKFLEGGN